jgi:hypothetical protein
MPKHGQSLKAKVRLGSSPMDCWIWLGPRNPKTGYGKKQLGDKTISAHRWVYEQLLGPIERGKVINHLCNTRACVNPFHLEVTTQAINCRKGLGTKLRPEQVLEIIRAKDGRKWGDGKLLAIKYGVSSALIHDIWRGRAWRDISP